MATKNAGKHATSSTSERERVQKLIAAAGLCSRREAEDWIRQERVEVNGKVVTIGESATRKDLITVNGVRVVFPQTTYLMLHKPKGYVTTMRDVYGKRTVLDLVHSDERIYPVGRLDKDTTGLLLFTNDGEFANRVMHPRYELEKVYLATIDKAFNPTDAKKFELGIRFEEGIVRAHVKQRSLRRIEVSLHQGYNHVVKRLCAAFGYRVLELERIRVGPVALDIPLSAYRPLKQTEVDALMAAAQPKPRPPSKLPGEELKTRFGTADRTRAPHYVPPHDRLSLPRGPPRANRGEAPANMWEELGPARAMPARSEEPVRPKRLPREIEMRAPRAPFSREPGARRYGGKRDRIPERAPPRDSRSSSRDSPRARPRASEAPRAASRDFTPESSRSARTASRASPREPRAPESRSRPRAAAPKAFARAASGRDAHGREVKAGSRAPRSAAKKKPLRGAGKTPRRK